MYTSGFEQIPEEGQYLLVSNHISNFDPIVGWHLIGLDKLIFVTKPENFNQPFFGRIIYRCGFLGIDRENPRNALKTIQQAAKVIKEDGMSVAIYPEGTRNRKGTGLLPFHHGALKIAQLANVPIVVTTVKGTPDIAKRFPWRGTDVYVDVLEVIPAETVKNTKTVDMGNQIRKLMLENLGISEEEQNISEAE